jgi:hypothetical protein
MAGCSMYISSSMGIQRVHIGCESHSDERGSSRGRRKSKTIADTCGPCQKFRFVQGKRRERAINAGLSCLLDLPQSRLAPSAILLRDLEIVSVDTDKARRHVAVTHELGVLHMAHLTIFGCISRGLCRACGYTCMAHGAQDEVCGT